jgi:hypothetical protein
VSAVANLSLAPAKDVVSKKLVANLVACPTLGAPSRETQANPLLDNYEGGGRVHHASLWHRPYRISSRILTAAWCAASAVASAPQEQAPAAGRITGRQNPADRPVTDAVTVLTPDPGTSPEGRRLFPTRSSCSMNAASTSCEGAPAVR